MKKTTARRTGRDVVPGFAAAVRTARHERGWSQRELAERAGTHPQTVVMIEAETRAPSLRLAAAIAGPLDLDLNCYRENTPEIIPKK